MNQSSKLFGHVETLHKRVDITGITHILKSPIPITNFSFMPILLLFLVVKLSDGILIEKSMNLSRINRCIVEFFYLA